MIFLIMELQVLAILHPTLEKPMMVDNDQKQVADMDDLHNKTILMTGGTGFIGRSLCHVLADRGAQVVALTRKAQRSGTPGITYIKSLADIGAKTPDIIINLAGEPIAQRWTASAKEKIRASRINTTASLIDYIKFLPTKPTLFISASAIGYYGIDDHITFDENTQPSTHGAPFARDLCAAWEATAMQVQKEYGVRTVILRIGAVLGKDGGMLGKLLWPFRLGLGGPIGHGRQWLSWIDRGDLIDLILHVIRTPQIDGAVNATSPHPVTNNDFSRTLARALCRPCLLRTPAFVLRLIFGDMADEIMLGGQKVFPRKATDHGFVFTHPTLAASLQEIIQ